MGSTHQVVLASASPRRELLLREMGLRFEVVLPHGVEEVADGLGPEALATHNAQLKARAVAHTRQAALVIGADTIVVLDGVIYGKPRDLAEAATMLGSLAGKAHDVFTGVCVVHPQRRRETCFCERTRVWMKPFSADQIATYFQKVNPLDKAGAYAAQEHGATIIDRLDGSFANVMGLPVERLSQVLAELGRPAD